MTACAHCNQAVSRQFKEKSIACAICAALFHIKCVNLGKAEIDALNATGLEWRCAGCLRDRRTSRANNPELSAGHSQGGDSGDERADMGSAAFEGGVTLQSILTMIKKSRDEIIQTVTQEIKSTESDLGTSIEVANQKLDGQSAMCAQQQETINILLAKMEELKTENNTLRKRVGDLEARLEEQCQYTRRNTVEICNIPVQPNENTVKLVQEIGKAVKMDVKEEMVDACHRLPTNDPQKIPPIVVKFVRRIDKELLMDCKRKNRKDLSTRHIELAVPDDRTVFFNESLTPAYRHLLYEARQLKRNKRIAYVWVRNGSVLARKQEKGPAVVIKTKNDIASLAN